jgi:hypothetical protein
MSSDLPMGPRAGNIRSNTAMTYRPSYWIGMPTRPTVRKGIRALNGRQATMSQAIRCFGSALTGLPVVSVPPGRCVPRRKTPHGNSPYGPKPTMRRSRLHANGRRRPSSKPNMPCGLGWRVASRRAYDASISARVDTWGSHGRTCSSSSRRRP